MLHHGLHIRAKAGPVLCGYLLTLFEERQQVGLNLSASSSAYLGGRPSRFSLCRSAVTLPTAVPAATITLRFSMHAGAHRSGRGIGKDFSSPFPGVEDARRRELARRLRYVEPKFISVSPGVQYEGNRCQHHQSGLNLFEEAL